MATDSLHERLQALGWPTPLQDHPEPGPGQVWRAAWGAIAGLVVITSAPAGRTVAAIAASPEDEGDNWAVRIDMQNDMTLTAWCGIRASIKTFTLEHRIGDLTPWSMVRVTSVGDSDGDWIPITDAEDDRAVERAELLDELEELRTAEWLPQVSVAGATLGQLVEREGITVTNLAGRLGVAPGRAHAIIRGETATTPEEDALLADLLGSNASPAFVVDGELLPDLDSPVIRTRLGRFAEREFGGDWQKARLAAASASMGIAARHRESGGRNWRAIIAEVLRED